MGRVQQWLGQLGRLTGTHVFRRLPRGVALDIDLQSARPGWAPTVIVDVGANRGQSAKHLRRSYPFAVVHCIEPGATAVGELRHRMTADITSGKVLVHHLALGRVAEPGRLGVEGPTAMHRLIPPGDGPYEGVAIDTLDAWAEREGVSTIGFLKIDTEGHDLAVLEGATRLLGIGAIETIQVEAGMNPDNHLHAAMELLKPFLEAHGFRLFGVYNQVSEWPTREPHLRRADLVFVHRGGSE